MSIMDHADIMAVAKGIGGGFPLGPVSRPRKPQRYGDRHHGSTYGGKPARHGGGQLRSST